MAARSREPYHRAQCRTEARRPDGSERRSDRALRRSLNEAAYADLALAGAAGALLHPHWAHVMHWAKAGAANSVANAAAAISVFMVSLHRTDRRRAGLLTCHRIRFGERNCYLPSKSRIGVRGISRCTISPSTRASRSGFA